jgi:hypothetical protein
MWGRWVERRVGGPRPLNRNWVTGRAVVEARTIHVSDVLNSEDFPEGREMALRFGHRATLAVPLLREECMPLALSWFGDRKPAHSPISKLSW